MKPLIKARGISKSYRNQRRNRLFGRQLAEPKWVLDDVSFDVQAGEQMAIIGRNGAGKSSLLKILSGIVAPTRGEAWIRGKVASLLELGAGFHPDLTGWENLYFYASLIGFSRREVKAKLDEIVDFSGIESHMGRPLRTYSSGMKLRLAFSIAAFLETDVIILDEVLAVGDMAFRKKCLSKLDEEKRKGRGMLIVNHSMEQLTTLCTTGMLLEGGKVKAIGSIKSVADAYYSVQRTHQAKVEYDKQAGQEAQLLTAALLDASGQECESFGLGDPITLSLTCEVVPESGRDYYVGFHLFDEDGLLVFPSSHRIVAPGEGQKALHRVVYQIPENLLNDGGYEISISAASVYPIFVTHFQKHAPSHSKYPPACPIGSMATMAICLGSSGHTSPSSMSYTHRHILAWF